MKFIKFILVIVLKTMTLKSSYSKAAKMLSHYLVGSGESQYLGNEGEEFTKVLKSMIREFIIWDGYGESQLFKREGTKYVLSHSTAYEGSGFWGRNALFYTLGRFAFSVRRSQKGWIITGSDPYVWGPEKDEYGSERWFTTPLPYSRWISRCILKIIGASSKGEGTIGEGGISNRFWADMSKVGARPFDIHYSALIPFSVMTEEENEWLNNHH
jgi:hypothetical protein